MKLNYCSLLAWQVQTNGEKTAFILNDQPISHAVFFDNSLKVANWLRQKGIQKGDRVGILDVNTLEAIFCIHGCILNGAVPIMPNWKSTPTEISEVLENAEVKLFIKGEAFAEAVAQIDFPETSTFSCKEIVESLASIAPLPFSEINFDKESDLLQIYTSGTTGQPKGVVLPHKNLMWLMAEVLRQTPAAGPDMVNLVCGPMYNIAGIGWFAYGLLSGGMNVVVEFFHPTQVCSVIEKHKVTNVFFAPVMLNAILSLGNIEEFDFSSVRNLQYGGSPPSVALLQKARTKFKHHFTQSYGLTETSGILTMMPSFYINRLMEESENPDAAKLQLSAGKPVWGATMKILDDIGAEVSQGQTGEVCAKSNGTFHAYWKNEEATQLAFDEQGWFHTGDIGYFDENGFLFLIDRKHDRIITSGNNVYPAEIEAVFSSHEAIKECVAIGIAHEITGEAICLVAIVNDPSITLAELRKWAGNRLPAFKLPSEFIILDELPRNPTGKVLRRVLRENRKQPQQ